MRTNRLWTLLLSVALGASAWAQPLPIAEGEDIPLFDGKTSDLLGSIANTNSSQIIAERITQGVLKPAKGIEDIFIVKNAATKIDLSAYGNICIQATVGGIITSKNPAERPLPVEAGGKAGSTMLIVTERLGGPENCAKATGQENLIKVIRVTVTDEDVLKLMQELQALVGNVEGLEIRIVGSQVVLDGKIVAPNELRRLLTVLEKHPQGKNILNLVEVSPLSLQIVSEKMEEAIAGGPDRPRDIKVKVLNGRFFLEGAVDKRAQRDEAIKICQSFITERYRLEPKGVLTPDPGLTECNNLVFIRQGPPSEPDPIISVRVDFVSLSRNYLKNFNFSWNPGIRSDGSAVGYNSDLGKFTANFIGTVTNLFPKLQQAQSHGYGRILKSASLLVRDGQGSNATGGQKPPDSTISETIEVPFQQTTVTDEGRVVQSASSRKITTTMTVNATSIPGSDKLLMGISAAQEDIKDQREGQAPTTIRNDVKTELIVRNNESAALGGLISERRVIGYSRNPTGIESDFELFSLARSHNLIDDKSQFIIFVTAEKMRTPSQGTEQLKRKFRLRR